MRPHHPSSTLFPYTTLFRSSDEHVQHQDLRLRFAEERPCVLHLDACLEDLVLQFPGGQVDGIQTVAQSVVPRRSEEHTSELQSQSNLVCRLLLEKKKIRICQ